MDADIDFPDNMMAPMQQTMRRLNNVHGYLNDIKNMFMEKKPSHIKIKFEEEEEDGRPRKKIKVEKEEDGKEYIINPFVAENKPTDATMIGTLGCYSVLTFSLPGKVSVK